MLPADADDTLPPTSYPTTIPAPPPTFDRRDTMIPMHTCWDLSRDELDEDPLESETRR